jgi:pimeloyl-ACP methyl ester carboxylesterase
MEDQFLDIGGCRVRYRDSGGDGPVVLMIHGISESLEFWGPQLDAAGEELRVIALDVPGHGLSAPGDQPYGPEKFARFMWQLVDALGIDKLTLVGNSMGGAISVLMAGLAPERVKGLLLANSALLGQDTPVIFRLLSLPVIGSLLSKPNKKAVEGQINVLFYDQSAVSETIKQVIERNNFHPGNAQSFRNTLKLMVGVSGQLATEIEKVLATLGRLQMPVLFLHGRQDAVLPFSHSVEAEKRVTNSQLVIFEDCGHTPQIEKPEEFNKLLREFVAGLEKAQ